MHVQFCEKLFKYFLINRKYILPNTCVLVSLIVIQNMQVHIQHLQRKVLTWASVRQEKFRGGKKSVINRASLWDQTTAASVYISHHTKPSGSTECQRYKDLPQHKDLAHAAWGFVAALTFWSLSRATQQPSGAKSCYNPFWKEFPFWPRQAQLSPLAAGWSWHSLE